MRKRRGKKEETEGGLSLADLEGGIGETEPARPRTFEDVRGNTFGEAPTSWKLQDSQEDWLNEATQASDLKIQKFKKKLSGLQDYAIVVGKERLRVPSLPLG